jgi:hypothetical protein
MNANHPANVVLRGGPDPVGPRHIQVAEPSEEIKWRAANGSGVHVWHRTGESEEFGGEPRTVYEYVGPDEHRHGGQAPGS